ncbi:hypothetical protein K1719_013555 [Acacia pycnantha]|nr:hypothetical protein K1719_013555 [Acacia pycnantha]
MESNDIQIVFPPLLASLVVARQELKSQIERATQELKKVRGDVKSLPDLQDELDNLVQEHQRLRIMIGDAAVELENCRMEPKQLDPKHSAELLKHLDKQNEFLQDSYKLMFNELQKLQVEEEMLMHKLYEAMPPYGLAKKADNIGIANGDDTVDNHVENEQKGAGEIANGDDMVDKHQENEQNRTIKIADGDDAMDKNGENEQNRTSKMVNGDDTDNKPLENEGNRAIEIANGDDKMDKPVEHEQNGTRRSTRERKKAWKLRANDE